jgi:hypothetical protein
MELTPQTVSVIIAALGDAPAIADAVESCRSQTYPVAEVLVVADGDDVAQRASEAGARVLRTDGGSRAAALNLALGEVTSRLVVTLDSSATLAPDAVAELAGTIRAGNVGAYGATIPSAATTLAGRYRVVAEALGAGALRTWGGPACHRSAELKAIGGVPEGVVADDVELAMDLSRRGYPIAFSAGAVAHAPEPASLGELLAQRHRWAAAVAQAAVRHVTLRPLVPRLRAPRLGLRDALRDVPAWLLLAPVVGVVTGWWLFREWVLGRHLAAESGIGPLSRRRKIALTGATALVLAVAALALLLPSPGSVDVVTGPHEAVAAEEPAVAQAPVPAPQPAPAPSERRDPYIGTAVVLPPPPPPPPPPTPTPAPVRSRTASVRRTAPPPAPPQAPPAEDAPAPGKEPPPADEPVEDPELDEPQPGERPRRRDILDGLGL